MVAGLLSSQPLHAQTMPADSGKSNVIVSSFKPVPLPDPKIPGYTYPVAADTITAWTKSPKGQIEIQVGGASDAIQLTKKITVK